MFTECPYTFNHPAGLKRVLTHKESQSEMEGQLRLWFASLKADTRVTRESALDVLKGNIDYWPLNADLNLSVYARAHFWSSAPQRNAPLRKKKKKKGALN